MTSSMMQYNLKEKLLQKAIWWSQSECPNYNCEDLPEQHFQADGWISVKNPGAHFGLKNSTNQMKPMLLSTL